MDAPPGRLSWRWFLRSLIFSSWFLLLVSSRTGLRRVLFILGGWYRFSVRSDVLPGSGGLAAFSLGYRLVPRPASTFVGKINKIFFFYTKCNS